MTLTLPLVLVLGIAAWFVIRMIRLRWWAIVPLVLFGFYLAHTVLAPVVDHTTRTGVDVVNTHTK